LGEVLKPRGLAGEVKVKILTNKPEAFAFVENVEKLSFSGVFAFIKFKGVDYEAAQNMRGKLVQIPFDKFQLDDDEVLADELIGFEVVGQDGEFLGTVKDIQSVGASEVFDCGHFMFPNEDAFVVETNMKTRRIVVKKEMLDAEVVL